MSCFPFWGFRGTRMAISITVIMYFLKRVCPLSRTSDGTEMFASHVWLPLRSLTLNDFSNVFSLWRVLDRSIQVLSTSFCYREHGFCVPSSSRLHSRSELTFRPCKKKRLLSHAKWGYIIIPEYSVIEIVHAIEEQYRLAAVIVDCWWRRSSGVQQSARYCMNHASLAKKNARIPSESLYHSLNT